MSYFSERVKTVRQELGLTMQALADEAKVCKSMICKIEKDDVQPTIDVACRIAYALGKPLSEMLHITQPVQVLHLPKEKQPLWIDEQNIKRRTISPIFEGLKLEWLHIELPAKATIAKSAAPAGKSEEKFILVTKGTLEVMIDQQKYKMKKGDSLYFEAACSYEFSNPSKDTVEYDVVCKYR